MAGKPGLRVTDAANSKQILRSRDICELHKLASPFSTIALVQCRQGPTTTVHKLRTTISAITARPSERDHQHRSPNLSWFSLRSPPHDLTKPSSNKLTSPDRGKTEPTFQLTGESTSCSMSPGCSASSSRPWLLAKAHAMTVQSGTQAYF